MHGCKHVNVMFLNYQLHMKHLYVNYTIIDMTDATSLYIYHVE